MLSEYGFVNSTKEIREKTRNSMAIVDKEEK